MKLIMEKHDDVFIFSTFFYTKLLNHGLDSVFHWYKRVNLAEKRLLIFPVYQKADSHWCLAVADVPAKQLTCFDSLEKENSDCSCLVLLKNYLFKLNGQCYSIAEEKSIPRQLNSDDCGVFTCLYARFLAANCRFDFSQSDIPAIREKMKSEKMLL